MSQAYYKLSSAPDGKTLDECTEFCEKDPDVNLIYYGKDKNICECLIQVDNIDNADDIYTDVSPSYKINPVAFWITFSIFIVFIIILIYFFIQVFFIQVKKH